MREHCADAVKHVLALEPKDASYRLSDSRGLKIVVQWASRDVWLMSNEEALRGGLPSVLDN